MGERNYDRMLNIKTTGIREWEPHETRYNRYEATPYSALNRLFTHYKFKNTEHVLDFGSGRGRVAFYIHHNFQIPVTGIEMNDKTYEEAIINKASYRQKVKQIKAPLRFKYGLAEHYSIKPIYNTFYFFNPFSAHIFNQVVKNIVISLETKERPMDIILYYPMPKYKKILKTQTPFKLINKVKIPKVHNPKEKFLVYRYSKNES